MLPRRVKSGVFKKPNSPATVVTPTELINGNCPSATPATVVTPVTDTLLVPFSTTLTIDLRSLFNPPKLRRLPTLILPGNCGFELVTVLNPVVPFTTVIVPSPNKKEFF